MKQLSTIAIVLGVIAALICIISRLTWTPVLGVGSQAIAQAAGLLFLFAIAINTLK